MTRCRWAGIVQPAVSPLGSLCLGGLEMWPVCIRIVNLTTGWIWKFLRWRKKSVDLSIKVGRITREEMIRMCVSVCVRFDVQRKICPWHHTQPWVVKLSIPSVIRNSAWGCCFLPTCSTAGGDWALPGATGGGVGGRGAGGRSLCLGAADLTHPTQLRAFALPRLSWLHCTVNWRLPLASLVLPCLIRASPRQPGLKIQGMQIRGSDDRTLTRSIQSGLVSLKHGLTNTRMRARTHGHAELQCCITRYAAKDSTTKQQRWNLFSQGQAGSARVGDIVRWCRLVSASSDLVSKVPSGGDALQINVSYFSKTGGSEFQKSSTTREIDLQRILIATPVWPPPLLSFFNCAGLLCESGSRASSLQQCRRTKDTIFVPLSVCVKAVPCHMQLLSALLLLIQQQAFEFGVSGGWAETRRGRGAEMMSANWSHHQQIIKDECGIDIFHCHWRVFKLHNTHTHTHVRLQCWQVIYY